MEIYTKQELIDAISPELSTREAIERLPLAELNIYSIQALEAAAAESKRAADVCADNGKLCKFLSGQSSMP